MLDPALMAVGKWSKKTGRRLCHLDLLSRIGNSTDMFLESEKNRWVNHAAADEGAHEELVTYSGTTTELARCPTAVTPKPGNKWYSAYTAQAKPAERSSSITALSPADIPHGCRYSRRPGDQTII